LVTLTVDGTPVTATLDVAGQAVFARALATGPHNVSAAFAGGSGFAASTTTNDSSTPSRRV